MLLLPSNPLVLLKLLFLVFLVMELNFFIDDDLSLEVVLMPLLSLSLCALILLLLQLFLDRQSRNEVGVEEEEEDAEEALVNGNWGEMDEDNGKIE